MVLRRPPGASHHRYARLRGRRIGETYTDSCEAAIVLEDSGPLLPLAAAHELGHALGLPHEADPASLMHGDLNAVREVSGMTRCLVRTLAAR